MNKSPYVFAGKFLACDAQQCVKSARIRSYSDRYFPAFGLNTPFLSLERDSFPFNKRFTAYNCKKMHSLDS